MYTKPTMKHATPSSTVYSPSIAQDLLNGTNEWINIQDIVKLTFKALFDVVKAQGEAIRDLEQLMPTKATKAEVNSALSGKANIADVSKTLAEISANIESRATFGDMQRMLAQKADRDELSKTVPRSEVETLFKNDKAIESDMSNLNTVIENMQRSLSDKLDVPSFAKQMEELKVILSQKANITDVSNEIQKKASKDSVASALQKKADKKEIEAVLSHKVDIADIQKVAAAVERKVDSSDLEIMQKRVDHKLAEVDSLAKELATRVSAKDLDVAI